MHDGRLAFRFGTARSAAFTWVLLAGLQSASAEPEGARTASVTHMVVPPELTDFVQAECQLAANLPVSVLLELEIDRQGDVSNARVLEPGDGACSEAARSAALRFRFQPARRGAVPVASRVHYRYELRSTVPPDAEPATAPARQPPAIVATPPLEFARPSWAKTATAEVVVQGPSAAERQRQSAEAVKVIETEIARRQTQDLGEVLARVEGVSVRRDGGLGSGTRFSLNGLADDQIRFFVDGVPLEFAGYPFGIANIPVSLVERVEVYAGVVPVRFGADALGGAVNLITDGKLEGVRGALSYEAGSFGTTRLTLSAGGRHRTSGLFARASGFMDKARNDYPVDVQVADELGQLSAARVRRFHDGYRAFGANGEFGVVERRWAKRLLLRVFASGYHKEYQSNLAMTVPYGDVSYGNTVLGESLRYEQPLARGLALSLVAGFTRSRARFLDVGSCIYDWFGRCVRDRGQRGETDARAHDQLRIEDVGYVRANLRWLVAEHQVLQLSSAASLSERSGDERQQSDALVRDPLSGEHTLLTWVNGIEHRLDALGGRLENIAFVKQYLQGMTAEEPPVTGGELVRSQRGTHRLGVGDGVRCRFTPWLTAKASYEFATRLPRADEVFGDNAFVVANPALSPETSHNLNAGFVIERRLPTNDSIRASVNGFLRDARGLIVLVGSDRLQSYRNVLSARSLGLEVATAASAFAEHLVVEGNLTYQDFRNTSSGGSFGEFAGDRVPNRPYFFANAAARIRTLEVAQPRDELALSWSTRYVHEFYRGWESVGLRAFKQTIAMQLAHNASVGYRARGKWLSLSTVIEVQNLTDARLYDFFGVQRPGRAFFVKTSADF
jgi:vitamin B12 transporter